MEASLIRKARRQVRWQLVGRVVVLMATILISLSLWYLTFALLLHPTSDDVTLIQPDERTVQISLPQRVDIGS